MDRVKQQDSTPQNDSTLGFKWIKKNRVLHKDEKILMRKHIYLPHAQTAIYDSKVKLFLKQGISHQFGHDSVVRFECENSAIDVIINFL
jgi:hypothetical protein